MSSDAASSLVWLRGVTVLLRYDSTHARMLERFFL